MSRLGSRRHLAAIIAVGALALAGHAAAQTVVQTTSYVYDSLGRLVTVFYTSGGTTTVISYSYDAAGNRTQTISTTASSWGGFHWGSGKW